MTRTRSSHDPELRAWTSMLSYALENGNLERSLGLSKVEVGDATAWVATEVDSLLFNRALARDPAEVPALARVYVERGVERFMISLPPGTAARPDPKLGLERFARPWIELGGRPSPQWIEVPGLVVRVAGPEDADAVARLYCEGFDVPLVAAPIIAGLIGRPCWHVYVAEFREAEPSGIVGLGISHLEDGEAYLFGGVTAPSHRCRGVQRALIAARVHHAYRCGATWVATDTGVAVPGQPNYSQHNLERAGLQVVSMREHLVPRATRWRGASS